MKKTLPIFILFLAFGLFSASFASAATAVYYSVGQDATTDRKTGTPTISLSSGVATFSVAQTGNIGVGDVITYDTDKKCYISGKTSTSVWSCATATGTAPTDITGSTVVSIKRVFTSLSGAESGAPALLGTSDLVTGNFQLNFPCYYDTGPDTTATEIDGWTTGAGNYIKVFTPNDTATEANFSQRHNGKWDEGKYRLEVSGDTTGLSIKTSHVIAEGVQVMVASTDDWQYESVAILIKAGNATANSCILKIENNYYGSGLGIAVWTETNSDIYIFNNIIFRTGDITTYTIGITLADSNVFAYNNTVIGFEASFYKYPFEGWLYAVNNIAQYEEGGGDSGDYLYWGLLSGSYNISRDSTAPGANSITNATVQFMDADNNDYRLSLDDTVARNTGADLSADPNLVFSSDIQGEFRPSWDNSNWDIGADEYTPPIPVYFSVSGGADTSDKKTGAPTVTIASGVATFSVAQTGNIGVGDVVTYDTSQTCYISGKTSQTVWSCATAVGGVPTDITGSTVVSIKRVFTSLSGAEDGAPALLGTSDLVAGNFQLNFPCYYDTGADTTAVEINGWTTGADNFIKVYTPNNTSVEANFSQKHSGIWDEEKYRITANADAVISVATPFVHISGLQISVSRGEDWLGYGIRFTLTGFSDNWTKASENIIREINQGDGSFHVGIFYIAEDQNLGRNFFAYNNIIYDFINIPRDYGSGIRVDDYAWSEGLNYHYLLNNTIYGCRNGIDNNSAFWSLIVKNNISHNNIIDFLENVGIFNDNSTHNLSSDDTAPGSNSLINQNPYDIFVDPDNHDFRLKENSPAIDAGADLSAGMDAVDIMGNSRPRGLAWDIGAHEAPVEIFRSVGPGATTSLNTDSRTVEISGSTATFSGAMPNNVGVGDVLQYQVDSTYHLAFIQSRTSDTVYSVRKADGTAPTATPAGTAVSVFRAYTSLANAESGTENTGIESTVRNFDTWTGGRDLVSNNEQWNIACYANGTTADSVGVAIGGWTTGEHNYLKVYTPVLSSEVGVSQRHEGKWDESKYKHNDGYFVIVSSYTQIEGLQVEVSGNGVYVWAVSEATRISHSIIKQKAGGTANYGVRFDGIGSTLGYAYNNIIYDIAGFAGGIVRYYDGSGRILYAYNNTVYNISGQETHTAGIGSWQGGSVVAKNNVVYNSGKVDFYNTFHADSTHNLSSDSTAPGANSITEATVQFVDEVNDDFHLSPNDTSALGKGTDLSADANLSFSTDIDGENRVDTWDIGADEFFPGKYRFSPGGSFRMKGYFEFK
jgi:hypothetical protein